MCLTTIHSRSKEKHYQIVSVDLKLNFPCKTNTSLKKKQNKQNQQKTIHLTCLTLDICYVCSVYHYFLEHDTSKKHSSMSNISEGYFVLF